METRAIVCAAGLKKAPKNGDTKRGKKVDFADKEDSIESVLWSADGG